MTEPSEPISNLNLITNSSNKWDGVSVPVQPKTKRLQKISPLLAFWSVGLGMKFL
jgi:hypothetical protein